MRKIVQPLTVLATMLVPVLYAVPAHALATRTFVAAQGSDSNPCTFAAPCRSFQAAYNVTAAGGEIDVLDPAGYGALTITGAISIQGHGYAGLAVPSGNGLTINAGLTDKINLRGLLIDGVGTGGDGIVFNTGGSLNIQDCVIRNFAGAGIHFLSTASVSTLFSVSDMLVADNGGNGIDVKPTGAVVVTGVFNRVEIDHNAVIALSSTATQVPGRSSSP
jgi:hypothetical protein